MRNPPLSLFHPASDSPSYPTINKQKYLLKQSNSFKIPKRLSCLTVSNATTGFETKPFLEEAFSPPHSVVIHKPVITRNSETKLLHKSGFFSSSFAGPSHYKSTELLNKYLIKIEELNNSEDVSPPLIGKILEELFTDLSKHESSNKELYELMKGMVKKLRYYTSSNTNLNTGAESLKNVLLKKNKLSRSNSIQIPKINSNLEGDPLNRPISRQQLKKVPKLNILKMEGANSKGYNDEFLEHIDVFSESWRKDAESMKTYAQN